MQPGDLPGVLLLVASAPQAPIWREEDYQSFFLPGEAESPLRRKAWVLCADKAVAGFVAGALLAFDAAASSTALTRTVECELEFITVAGKFRQQGCGARLIEALVQWSQEEAADLIRLEVRTSNLAAIRLYRKHGFVETGQRRAYYRDPNEDALLMEARLASREILH